MTSPEPVGDVTGNTGALVGDPFEGVVGQEAAVAFLRTALAAPVHAYLLLGPHGSGQRSLARAFAAGLLADGSTGDAARRHVELALAEQHPDLVVVERVGSAISADQADEIVRRASRTPVEGARKVLVLDEFHLIDERVGPKLLKTVEEPTPGTFFVVLADELVPELVTLASRCVRVDLGPLSVETVAGALVARGIDRRRAEDAAAFAEGDIDRALLLATDDRLGVRLGLWRSVPDRLDGRGTTVATLVDEVRANIDDAEAPLGVRQRTDVAELNERIERYGERGSGAGLLERRHRRESRRLRTDELRLGLAALARAYRDELAVAQDPRPFLEALDAIQSAAEALLRNPNEELMLLGLFVSLPSRW